MSKDLFGEDIRVEPEIDGDPYAGYIVHETDQAILFNHGTGECWLPKKVIHIEENPGISQRLKRGVIVTVPEKLAIEKEII